MTERRSRPHGAAPESTTQTTSSIVDHAGHPLPTISTDGITRLLKARSADCNGPTLGDVEAILDGFVLFLTRHATNCPMWGERARQHGVGSDDVRVHPLGHLAGDEDVLVFLGDVGDGVCDG